MPHETTVYTREKLYEEIWERPIREVAKAYGISDAVLVGICRKLNVPRPSNQYRGRRAAGHEVAPIPLPVLKEGEPSKHEVSRWVEPELSADEQGFRARPEFQLVSVELPFLLEVASTLERPHRCIATTLKGLRKAKPGHDGLVSAHGVDGLPVNIATAQIDRALRFLDALIKGLERAGHQLLTREGYGGGWHFVVGGEEVHFHLRERLAQSPHVVVPGEFYAPKFDHRPSGELRFQIKYDRLWRHGQEWGEPGQLKLDARINEIFKALLEVGPHQKARKAEREARELIRAEEDRRRQEEQQRILDAQREAEALVEMSEKWARARVLLEFVEAVRAEAVRRSGTIEPGSPAARWLERAALVAAAVDPLPGLFEPRDRPR